MIQVAAVIVKILECFSRIFSKNHSTLTGGKSLLLSFTETISLAVDSTLAPLPEGYEVKAFYGIRERVIVNVARIIIRI